MGCIKEINRNRILYKYISELKKVPYFLQDVQWWYIHPLKITTIFRSNAKHYIINDCFSTMCEQLDIELDDETYCIILKYIKDIHGVKKLR